MNLPPFVGAARKLVLTNLLVFFGLAVLGFVSPALSGSLVALLLLEPARLLHGYVWQAVTYAFLPSGILNTVFAMLTIWFIGGFLERERGGRWLVELYLVAAAGGAVIASLLCYVPAFGVRSDIVALGPWAAILGLLTAFAVDYGDQEMLLFFVLRTKAKYIVAIYVLIALAILLKGGDRFGAMTQLAAAVCGWMYAKFAPRRGLAGGASEFYFGLRNRYYKQKRRSAAKKFEVYMGKQGRTVHFDKDGKYLGPEDPTDKKWMN